LIFRTELVILVDDLSARLGRKMEERVSVPAKPLCEGAHITLSKHSPKPRKLCAYAYTNLTAGITERAFDLHKVEKAVF